MRNDVLVATLAGVLTIASISSLPSAKAADEKSALQDLLAENKNLTVQLARAEQVKGEIAKAELSISGADSALKSFKEKLKHDMAGLVNEANRIDSEDKQSGCPWGSSSTDEAFVEACNAEGRWLTELTKGLQAKTLSLQEVAQKLDQKQASITKRTSELFKKKKANNADLEDLYGARADFLRRYHAFVFRSEAYERLKTQTPIEQFCKGMSLPTAAECLKRLWDGAR